MSRRPHALIVGSAPSGDPGGHYPRLILAADILIAADAGLALCLAAGRVPDVCVGDFDSVDPVMLEEAAAAGAAIARYPTRKDESDLDLALAEARRRGVEHLSITAAFADRLDHTLAALGTLLSAADLEAQVDEPLWHAYVLDAVVRPVLDLHEPAGTLVSVIVLTESARVSAIGFEYPLADAELHGMSSRGLSNVTAARTQRVALGIGRALVIVNRSG